MTGNRWALACHSPMVQWYADGEIWQVPLPNGLAAGSYAVSSGLYRVRDRERDEAYDADGGPYLDSLVPLGNVMVQ